MINKIKTGSVKDIYSDGQNYYFNYSNRYSIFDWGEMPDHLNHKGKSLAVSAYLFFKYFGRPNLWEQFSEETLSSEWRSDQLSLLKTQGLSHHCLGLVDERGDDVTFEYPHPLLKVRPVEVIVPPFTETKGYDYSAYQTRPQNALVPLEIIFRFGVPAGSSLIRRLQKNPDYISELGLNEIPQEGTIFDQPMIEFSTKLEATDNYLTKAQAFANAGLSELEGKRLYGLATFMALKLKELYSSMGLELWDGKFEFAFGDIKNGAREFVWVDSLGPDEVRLMKNGIQLSKEYLRQVYKNSAWLKKVLEVKDIYRQEWKQKVLESFPAGPERLLPNYKENAEQIYMGLANGLSLYLGEGKIFKNCPDLDLITQKLK